MIKSIKNFLRQQRESFQIPKSTQNLIPVRRVWPDGIFLSGNGNMYSRTWRISDINYAVASQEDKRTMFLDTSALINAAETGGLLTITIFNRIIDRANMEKEVLHKLQGDDLDRLRVELNAILMEKALENNAIEQVKFITLSICKKNIDEARAWLNRSGMDMTAHLAVLGSVATPLDADERLHIFRDLFRPGEEGGFAFDMKATKRKGHSFLDSIAPDSYESLDGNTIKLGERYARALFLREYATYIKDTMISEFCDLPKTMMLSINILPIPTDEALAEVERKVMGVDTDISATCS